LSKVFENCEYEICFLILSSLSTFLKDDSIVYKLYIYERISSSLLNQLTSESTPTELKSAIIEFEEFSYRLAIQPNEFKQLTHGKQFFKPDEDDPYILKHLQYHMDE